MDRVRLREKIKDEAIEMDETVLIECELTNCVLIFRGGEPRVVATRWINTRYIYLEGAGNMVRLFMALGWQPPPVQSMVIASTMTSGLPN